MTDVSGVNTLTADVHNLDGNSGDTAVTLVYNATGYAVGGTTYYYRSAALTASTKTNGSTATFTATASDNAGNSTTTSNQTATWESTAPTVSVVVGPASFTTANYLSSATTFYAYANVTDVSGVNTLTADVHNLDGNSGDTAVTLVYNATGYAVGGTTYYYRSAALTASTKTNGSTAMFTATASDNAGNSTTTSNQTATWESPTVSVVVGPASFTTANYLSSAKTFYAYANATAASGISTLTADVHNLDGNSGDTAVTLVYNATGYAVGGTTYYYRSAALTASTKTNGSTATFTATVTDNAGYSTTTGSQTATWESTVADGERRGRTGLVHDGELPVERHHFLRLRQRDRCERCEHADR